MPPSFFKHSENKRPETTSKSTRSRKTHEGDQRGHEGDQRGPEGGRAYALNGLWSVVVFVEGTKNTRSVSVWIQPQEYDFIYHKILKSDD